MSKKKILITDDNQDIRFLVSTTFKKDYEVEQASNGSEAWEKITACAFDLIITDYEMPVLDGLALTQKILAQYPHLPVIMITGNPEVAPVLLGSGAAACLRKPLDFSGLKSLVANLLK